MKQANQALREMSEGNFQISIARFSNFNALMKCKKIVALWQTK